MKRAIVLSGGGSKGAYQIGVWKALRRLNIKYDIVTGTSVGALNAALMTQKTYFKGLLMWRNLEFRDVIDEDLKVDANSLEGKKEIIKTYAKNIVLGGMSVDNLEKTIDKHLNVKKFYNSPIDMGIVTVKSKNLEPVILTKKQIKPSDLKHYLIASSSCYPAFKKKNIGEEEYIDGGVFDNLPINLAISMGAEEVIAVDLKEIGIKQKVLNKDVPIITISPRNDIGSFLVFDSEFSKKAIQFGYNDTMKVFKKLDGYKFTFKKGQLLDIYKKVNNIAVSYDEFIELIDRVGVIFELDETKIYNIQKYNKLLIKKLKETEESLSIMGYLKENKIRKLFSNKYVIKYMYKLIKDNDSKINEMALLLPNEYKAALYLTIMEDL